MIFFGSMDDTPFARMTKQPGEIGGAETRSIYLLVKDADAIHKRANQAGAQIVIELEDASYGGRGCTCRDPESRHRSIGTFNPWEMHT